MEKEEIRIEFTKKLLDMGFVKAGDFALTKRMDSRRVTIYFRGIGIFVEFSSVFNVVSSMCVPYEHTKGDFNMFLIIVRYSLKEVAIKGYSEEMENSLKNLLPYNNID